MHTQVLDSVLDGILGPAHKRYFGGGYRQVEYDVHVDPLTGDAIESLAAHGSVRYGAEWSIVNGTTRTPHLSSIDAVVLPLLAFERVSRLSGLDLSRAWVQDVSLQAGTQPWLELDDVPITLGVHQNADEYRISSTAGNIRSRLVVALPQADTLPSDEPFGAVESVYSHGFNHGTNETEVMVFDHDGLRVDARHRFGSGALRLPLSGIESAYVPAVTAIDYIAIIGQMAQALAYAAAHTQRIHVDNLWMRRLSGHIGSPPMGVPDETISTTRVVRHDELNRGSQCIHSLHVESALSNGVSASALLAFSTRGEL